MSGANLAEERFRVWLQNLPADKLRALGEDYATRALAGGLAVLKHDGTTHPIPPSLTAVVDTPERLRSRADLAHQLLSGVVRTCRYYLGGAGRSQADAVLEGLSPWERELCDLTWRAGEQVAIARADLFTDDQGVDRPLELNATIPAMQAYSDVCAQAFLRAVGTLADVPAATIDRLARENGSNSDDLLQSLLAHHARMGGKATPRLAMVARAGDPQSTELSQLCAHFRAAGVDAHRCTPEQLELDADGKARLLGQPIDVIYRHIFARRIDPNSALGRIVREPERHHLLNPVNSQLEMKSIFAELSSAAAHTDLAHAVGLSEAEVAAAALIPWSRRLFAHRTTGPGGGEELDLVDFVKRNPARIVLKRSWGYGGTSVLLGDEIGTVSGQKRAEDILGREVGSSGADIEWGELVDHCVVRGGYIVQERVALFPQRHLVAGHGEPHWAEWYVDVSSYTNLGVGPRPTGSVRRGSASRIVNIVGGGGLVPILTEPVMEALLRAVGGA